MQLSETESARQATINNNNNNNNVVISGKQQGKAASMPSSAAVDCLASLSAEEARCNGGSPPSAEVASSATLSTATFRAASASPPHGARPATLAALSNGVSKQANKACGKAAAKPDRNTTKVAPASPPLAAGLANGTANGTNGKTVLNVPSASIKASVTVTLSSQGRAGPSPPASPRAPSPALAVGNATGSLPVDASVTSLKRDKAGKKAAPAFSSFSISSILGRGDDDADTEPRPRPHHDIDVASLHAAQSAHSAVWSR